MLLSQCGGTKADFPPDLSFGLQGSGRLIDGRSRAGARVHRDAAFQAAFTARPPDYFSFFNAAMALA